MDMEIGFILLVFYAASLLTFCLFLWPFYRQTQTFKRRILWAAINASIVGPGFLAGHGIAPAPNGVGIYFASQAHQSDSIAIHFVLWFFMILLILFTDAILRNKFHESQAKIDGSNASS